MNNIVSAQVITATSKKGNPYKCVEFTINCNGIKYTHRAYPSPLEVQLISQALSQFNGIYSDTSLKAE